MTTNPVDAAIEAARAEATKTGAIATAPQGGSVQNYEAPRKFTVDDLQGSGLNPDIYVSIDKHGLAFKGKDGLVDSMEVILDLSRGLHVFEAIRFGDPVQYIKTYDGVRSEQGGPWGEAVAKAQRVDPKLRPYQGADIAMEATHDAVNGKGVVVVEKGTVIGLSTSVTARPNLKAFTDQCKQQGLDGKTVLLRLSVEQKTNAKGSWGIPVFELLGEHNPDA